MANKPKTEDGKGHGKRQDNGSPGRQRTPRLDNLLRAARRKKEGKKRGAPTKYRPEYCAQLVAHMDEGYSFESFGALCDAGISTLYLWAETHAEFMEAKEKGNTKRLLTWEKTNRNQATKLNQGCSTNTIFTLKCVGGNGWNDQGVVPIAFVDDFDFNKLSPADRQKILSKAAQARGEK